MLTPSYMNAFVLQDIRFDLHMLMPFTHEQGTAASLPNDSRLLILNLKALARLPCNELPGLTSSRFDYYHCVMLETSPPPLTPFLPKPCTPSNGTSKLLQ